MERGVGGLRALFEQSYRRDVGKFRWLCKTAEIWHCEGWQRQDVLPAESQRRATGYQDLQIGATGQQIGHDGRRGQKVLKIVQ